MDQINQEKLQLEKEKKDLWMTNMEQILENWDLRQQLSKKDKTIAHLQQENGQIRSQIHTLQEQMAAIQTQETTESIIKPQTIQEPHLSRWIEVMSENICCVILGAPGSGKSSLGHMILELFRFRQTPYIIGFPEYQRHLLAGWIGHANSFDDVPPHSIILLDEAYLKYHSRRSVFTKDTQEMSQELGLARQREHSLIFVTHGARLLDKNILDYANLFLIKRPGSMSMRFERPELKQVLKDAQEAFQRLSGDNKRYCYVYSPEKEFEELMKVSLPSYWNEDLSHAYAFAGGKGSASRSIPSMSKDEKKKQAKDLRQSGMSYREIAKRLGVRSKNTIRNWIKQG